MSIADLLNMLFWLGRVAIGFMAAMWLWEHVFEEKVDKWLSRYDDEE